MIRFCFAELFSATDNLVELLQSAGLLIDQQLGVTDNVDEEHVGNLELDLFLNVRRHCGRL
jgi:hypothetical protein